MKIIIQWIILSLAVLAVAYLIPDVTTDSLLVTVIVGAFLTIINRIIKPIIKIVTLPINIITFGLFSFVVNGFLLWFLAQIIPGFTVATFVAAIIGALIVSVLNWIGDKIFY